ncbi:hypothetical protein F5B17DRAFT_181904 [Nemania serpens]|nr:hypothetical protein F5B17DRAFT_181904 [Nemania serpens]
MTCQHLEQPVFVAPLINRQSHFRDYHHHRLGFLSSTASRAPVAVTRGCGTPCIINACHALSAYTYCPTAWLRLCFSVLSLPSSYCSIALSTPTPFSNLESRWATIGPADISLNTTLQAWSRRLTLFVSPWSPKTLPVLTRARSAVVVVRSQLHHHLRPGYCLVSISGLVDHGIIFPKLCYHDCRPRYANLSTCLGTYCFAQIKFGQVL